MKTYLEAVDYGEVRAHSPFTLAGLLLVCAAAAVGLGYMVGASDSRTGSGGFVAEETKLYKEPETAHPLRKRFPEIFETEAVIVTFGADWCAACKRQSRALQGPSERYNVIKVDIEAKGKKTKWSALMDQLNLGRMIPVTVVFSKGEILKTFSGYTPWPKIKAYAEKAKKHEID